MTDSEWTDLHETIAQTLYADTWTDPKDNDPNPEWHHRFQWWLAVHAARLLVPVLRQIDGRDDA